MEDDELELSREQLNRIDEIDNAVFNLCKLLTEKEDLEWNMEFIGDIADYATDVMVTKGYRVRFPAIVYDGDDEHIEDYVEPVKRGKD